MDITQQFRDMTQSYRSLKTNCIFILGSFWKILTYLWSNMPLGGGAVIDSLSWNHLWNFQQMDGESVEADSMSIILCTFLAYSSGNGKSQVCNFYKHWINNVHNCIIEHRKQCACACACLCMSLIETEQFNSYLWG